MTERSEVNETMIEAGMAALRREPRHDTHEKQIEEIYLAMRELDPETGRLRAALMEVEKRCHQETRQGLLKIVHAGLGMTERSQEQDDAVCHCGERIADHTGWENHSPVAMTQHQAVIEAMIEAGRQAFAADYGRGGQASTDAMLKEIYLAMRAADDRPDPVLADMREALKRARKFVPFSCGPEIDAALSRSERKG